MRGHIEVLKYRCGSPSLLAHDKWIALSRRMALGRNLASSNYRVFQQNRSKADCPKDLTERPLTLESRRSEYSIRLPYWNSGLGKSWGDGQLPNKRQGGLKDLSRYRVIHRPRFLGKLRGIVGI